MYEQASNSYGSYHLVIRIYKLIKIIGHCEKGGVTEDDLRSQCVRLAGGGGYKGRRAGGWVTSLLSES